MVRRLSSIELQGVKTFATLTRLEFPGQVTAIVGPNGSGKSNIADSVRWVLGEQSYSLLRAKRTEDMIFSGSEQKSRSGMAMATITFNNEDGWLPIDFSEVSISHRAYRDGVNEYLINGQKVRLKDISELLSQTGLSERTYTIIGQGLVDVALALKPDERRELFEEAAGIGLYRSRKEDALRRLENTRKNLDRVLDIMTEIRPRLRSLERQAGRFTEYERVRNDLHLLLTDWYGYHWHQKQQDFRNSRSAYQDQEKRLASLREKNTEAQSSVDEARNSLMETRKALELAHSELSGHHRSLEEVTRELAIIDERERSYHQQISNLEIDLAHVEEEINGLISQEQGLKAEIEQSTSEHAAAIEQFELVESKLTQISGQKDAVESKLNGVRQNRLRLETKKVQIRAHIDELRNRIDSLNNNRSKIEHSVSSLESDIAQAEKAVTSAEQEFLEKRAEYQSVQDQLDQLLEKLDKANEEKQTLDQALAENETVYAKLAAQLEVLNQAEAALQGYSEGSKRIVEDSRQGKLPKGIEPLSKFIVVDEKYEKAIGAALGELADLLILPSKEADIVIQYLEANENDRVALFDLGQARSHSPNERMTSGDGIIGYAKDLIDVDPQYRGLVDQLFSDIILVRDTRVARKMLPTLRGDEKVVTLSGVVFHGNGVMLSGQNASGKRISRTRRQGEMQLEIHAHEAKISKLSDQKKVISNTIDQLIADQEILKKELQILNKSVEKAQQEQQDAANSLRRLREQMVWNRDQYQGIDETIQETQSGIEAEQANLMTLDQEITTLHDSEQEILVELDALSLYELQQERNQWQTERIVTRNALESSKQRYQDHQKRIIDAKERLSTIRARLSNLKENLDEIGIKKTGLAEKAGEINQTMEAIKASQVDSLSQQLEGIISNVDAVEKFETHIHQQVVVAERQFTQMQLEMSRREDQLNHLRERIEDDFGLVSFEFEQQINGQTPLPLGEKLIQQLPNVQSVSDSIEDDIKRLKGQIRRIGAVNPEAQQEFYEVKERYEYLSNQITDLEKASKDLREVIEKLDDLMTQDFIKTFKLVDQEFTKYFSRLFNGGEAKLRFADEENPIEGGIDIEARLPGRRQQGLALLSGGERSLTAVALIFALLKVSPTPFCILDEVDAMLDESNVGRFVDLLKELSQQTQFVIITHNRNTVQAADVIYGVTMGRDSTSQMISLKLEEVDQTYLE